MLYPTVQQTGSQFDDFTLRDADPDVQHPGRGQGRQLDVRGVRHAEPGRRLLGHRGDAFVDAPILSSPDLTRKLDGREYKFYFNGSHIHMIAIVQGGVAYWVQNTLRDDLSNPDMIAIARSLRPA